MNHLQLVLNCNCKNLQMIHMKYQVLLIGTKRRKKGKNGLSKVKQFCIFENDMVSDVRFFTRFHVFYLFLKNLKTVLDKTTTSNGKMVLLFTL